MTIELYNVSLPGRGVVSRLQANAFYGDSVPHALLVARDFSGPDGIIATMPELINSSINSRFDSKIWDGFHTSNTEEIAGVSGAGNNVVIVLHGGGFINTPSKIDVRTAQPGDYSSMPGLQGVGAELTDIDQIKSQAGFGEIRDLLKGKLPDGRDIEVYSFSDYRRGIANLPRGHAIVLDASQISQSRSEDQFLDTLLEDPLFISRVGGQRKAEAFLHRVRQRYNTETYPNIHNFDETDFSKPHVYFLTFNPDAMDGIMATYIWGNANFLAVDGDTIRQKLKDAAK
ncbi:MAG: hypothetical protein QS98_C0003G0093 [archaeon GW2011_AR3]|nr:MAG: hypothetical protein QS98_C0003G0093 [archaeon GW2011_AR3]MBS3110135.1 hypothetical protein [Candidatus Woesearchaeota archaeon]